MSQKSIKLNFLVAFLNNENNIIPSQKQKGNNEVQQNE